MATLNAANGTLDVLVTAGKSWAIDLTLRDSSGTLVNLTGYTATWVLKSTYGTSALLTVAPTLGGAAGTMQLRVAPAASAAIAAGQYVHEFEWTSGGGVVTGLSGDWTIRPEVAA